MIPWRHDSGRIPNQRPGCRRRGARAIGRRMVADKAAAAAIISVPPRRAGETGLARGPAPRRARGPEPAGPPSCPAHAGPLLRGLPLTSAPPAARRRSLAARVAQGFSADRTGGVPHGIRGADASVRGRAARGPGRQGIRRRACGPRYPRAGPYPWAIARASGTALCPAGSMRESFPSRAGPGRPAERGRAARHRLGSAAH